MKKSNHGLVLVLFSVSLPCFLQNAFADEKQSSLTLETAMNMAENYVFSSRIASENEELNKSKEDEQLRSMFPNVSLSGNYLKYSDQVNKAIGTPVGAQFGLPGTTVSSAGLTLSQPLMGLIPLYLSLQAASAQTESALHNKNHSKAEARFLGANSFINAVKAAQLLNVANSSVKVAQIQLRDGQAQFNAGKLTNADILKFKLNMENSQTNLIQAQTTSKVTLITLAETTGLKDTNIFSLPKNYSSIWENRKPKLQNLGEYINKALIARNDLQAIKSAAEAAKYGTFLAESSYLPSVNFVSNYSRNFEATDINIPASAVHYNKADVQDTWYYGIQFSWNLLDWGVRQAQISEAAANESTLNIQEEQAISQIKIDVTNNYLKLQDAYQTLDSAKVSVEYAKDVFLQIEAQFNNGQATTTDVLGASNDQTTALAKLANAVGDLDLAWLNLQKSVGERLTTLAK